MPTPPEACFSRIDDVQSLSADDFLDRFERFGFVWFRGGEMARELPPTSDILSFLKQHQTTCKKNWLVENSGDCETESDLTPASVGNHDGSFYVSTIIQNHQDGEAYDALAKKLPNLNVFQDLHCSRGIWVFVGHQKKKRKRHMVGRPEHVDDVTHSGTFHFQVSGSKTWMIRPHPDLYCGEELPELSTIPGAVQSDTTKSWSLRVNVEEGDVFVLNTKIWYHYTELPPSPWSVSLARDFYLPFPSPQNVDEGEVVLGEDDIPEEIPRTDDPNCALAEVEEEDGETKIALVAIKDIKEGDFLSVAEEDDEANLGNSNETIDPRAIAKRDYEGGERLLEADDIPSELPRSMEPNCELVTKGEMVTLVALTAIPEGGVFCTRPEQDEDYEEVEYDVETREIKR